MTRAPKSRSASPHAPDGLVVVRAGRSRQTRCRRLLLISCLLAVGDRRPVVGRRRSCCRWPGGLFLGPRPASCGS